VLGCELSSLRVLGLGSGHFRTVPQPEALGFGAFWRLGPEKGQGGGSAQARGSAPRHGG
jgi:hypothetical protein